MNIRSNERVGESSWSLRVVVECLRMLDARAERGSHEVAIIGVEVIGPAEFALIHSHSTSEDVWGIRIRGSETPLREGDVPMVPPGMRFIDADTQQLAADVILLMEEPRSASSFTLPDTNGVRWIMGLWA